MRNKSYNLRRVQSRVSRRSDLVVTMDGNPDALMHELARFMHASINDLDPEAELPEDFGEKPKSWH